MLGFSGSWVWRWLSVTHLWDGEAKLDLSLTLCSAPKSLFSRSSHNPDGDCHNPRNQTISPSQSDLVTTLKSSQRQVLQQVLCPCLRLQPCSSHGRLWAAELALAHWKCRRPRLLLLGSPEEGGGRREGETYVTTTTKQNTAETIFCHTKIYHSFFSLAVGGCGLLEEADLEMGSRLLPDDPEVAWSLRRCFFFHPVFSSAFCFPFISPLHSEFLFFVPIELKQQEMITSNLAQIKRPGKPVFLTL